MTYYGKVDNKSTVTTYKNGASIDGEGSAKANHVEILRELSSGLVSSVDHANEIAYNIHIRTRRE